MMNHSLSIPCWDKGRQGVSPGCQIKYKILTLGRIYIAAVVQKLVVQNHISRVPDPAVLQFREVATPSMYIGFRWYRGKTTQKPVGKREKHLYKYGWSEEW